MHFKCKFHKTFSHSQSHCFCHNFVVTTRWPSNRVSNTCLLFSIIQCLCSKVFRLMDISSFGSTKIINSLQSPTQVDRYPMDRKIFGRWWCQSPSGQKSFSIQHLLARDRGRGERERHHLNGKVAKYLLYHARKGGANNL